MSHDHKTKNISQAISEVKSGVLQPSAEFLVEQTPPVTRSKVSTLDAGKPDPEPSGENAVLRVKGVGRTCSAAPRTELPRR